MTFDSFESSVEGSQPIELYRFVLGSETFEYTSAEDQVTVGGLDYDPIPIKRTRVGQGPEERSNQMQITVPGTNVFARRYIANVPGPRAELTISRVQRPDFPGPEVVALFVGFVQSVAFTANAKVAKIAVLPITSAVSRPIPRFTYMGLCNHVLYDSGCKADDTDTAFRHTGTVTAINGNVITVSGATGFADDFFTAGFVEAGGSDSRLILDHVGNDLTLLLPFPEDILNTTVVVLAGCDHTITVCDQKFFTPEDVASNVINYGGFAFVPTRDIFQNGLF